MLVCFFTSVCFYFFSIKTDAVVNSIVRDLELGRGPLSKALLGKAGAEIQEELTEKGKGKDIKEGCVLQTGGYALGCSHVLHAVLPVWDQGKKSEKVLLDLLDTYMIELQCIAQVKRTVLM